MTGCLYIYFPQWIWLCLSLTLCVCNVYQEAKNNYSARSLWHHHPFVSTFVLYPSPNGECLLLCGILFISCCRWTTISRKFETKTKLTLDLSHYTKKYNDNNTNNMQHIRTHTHTTRDILLCQPLCLRISWEAQAGIKPIFHSIYLTKFWSNRLTTHLQPIVRLNASDIGSRFSIYFKFNTQFIVSTKPLSKLLRRNKMVKR